MTRRAAALGAALFVAGCARAPSSSPGAFASPTPPAAEASPAATATAPWPEGDRARLAGRLDALFGEGIFARAGAVAVVDAQGRLLYGRRALQPMTPASTLKLLVAIAAFDRFGPQHRFETSFVALGPPDAGGSLRGPLWFVGGGDPLFTSNDLRGGIGVLRRLGVRRVDGPLLIDDRALSGPERNPRWDPADLDEGYAAATSAVSLDQDTVEIHVTPGANGAPARITFEPPNDNVTIEGSVTTDWSAGEDDLRFRRVESDAALSAEPHHTTFIAGGRVPPGAVQKRWKPVLGMPAYVAGAIEALARRQGIVFAGAWSLEGAPLAGETLWLHRSQPLASIVAEMLTNSNNHTAEQLLRLLGAGGGGTDTAGLREERREFAALRLPPGALRAYDGSGLAPDDKIAPLALAELLAAELRGPRGGVFLQTLPRAGMEGTVKYHDLHAALGRTRAKSGHLEHVNALAGTVLTRAHGRVSFAFIVNDPSSEAREVYRAQDRALDVVAEF